MKGFIKMLEAIIASLIILSALTFFFSDTNARQTTNGWDDALLQIRADDILYTIANNNTLQAAVSSNDPAKLNSVLANNILFIINPSIDYSIQVEGIPNPVIYMGCLCDDDEKAQVEAMLSPLDFTYKGRAISIRVEKVTLSPLREETNVVFSFDPDDFTPSRYATPLTAENVLNKTLAAGKTLFLVSDLGTAATSDQYFMRTFNFSLLAGNGPTTGDFYQVANENLTSFKIAKYWTNVSGRAASFTFSIGSHVRMAATDNSILISPGVGGFSQLQTNKELINGRGRAVWMAPLNGAETDQKNLTKAMVMWASGESFLMDAVPKSPGQKNLKSSIFLFDRDTYQVTLTLWRVFQ